MGNDIQGSGLNLNCHQLDQRVRSEENDYNYNFKDLNRFRMKNYDITSDYLNFEEMKSILRPPTILLSKTKKPKESYSETYRDHPYTNNHHNDVMINRNLFLTDPMYNIDDNQSHLSYNSNVQNYIDKQMQYNLDINDRIFQHTLDISRCESKAESKPYFMMLLEDTNFILSDKKRIKNISFISNISSNHTDNVIISRKIDTKSNNNNRNSSNKYISAFSDSSASKLAKNNTKKSEIYDESDCNIDEDNDDDDDSAIINRQISKKSHKLIAFEYYTKRLDYLDIFKILSISLESQGIKLLFNNIKSSSSPLSNTTINILNDDNITKIQDIHVLSTNIIFKKFEIIINSSTILNQISLLNPNLAQEKFLKNLKIEIFNCLSSYIHKFLPDDIHIINIKKNTNILIISFQLAKLLPHQFKVCLFLLKKHFCNIIYDIRLVRSIRYIEIGPYDILSEKIHIFKKMVNETHPHKNMHALLHNINSARSTSNSSDGVRSAAGPVNLNNSSYSKKKVSMPRLNINTGNAAENSIYAMQTEEQVFFSGSKGINSPHVKEHMQFFENTQILQSYPPEEGWILFPLLHQEMQTENWSTGYVSVCGYGNEAQLKASELFRGGSYKNRRNLLLESIIREDVGPNRRRLSSNFTIKLNDDTNKNLLGKVCGAGILILNKITSKIDKQLYTCARVIKICAKGLDCDKVYETNKKNEWNKTIPLGDLIKNFKIYNGSVDHNSQNENPININTKKDNNEINETSPGCDHDKNAYLIAIQVKVRSDMIRLPSGCDHSLWVVNDPLFVKSVGILIKEIPIYEANSFEENHVII